MTRPVVAILGAGGFIGNRLIEKLCLEADVAVRAIVRRSAGLALAMRFPLDGRIADACDEAALVNAFEGCSHVVHAVAGPPEVITGSIAPVYRAAAMAGVDRLVYLSSASVHGQSPVEGTDETSPLSTRQKLPYNNAKVIAERTLRDLRGKGSVEIVLLRPGIVYGPRSYWTGGFADELLAGEAYLVEEGTGICNAIYVDNLVDAVLLALQRPGADGEAYLVSDAETVTWADLCRPVAEALGYDLDALTVSASAVVAPGSSLKQDAMGVLRQAAAVLPEKPHRALRAAYRAWRTPPDQPLPAHAAGPTVTQEKADLHQCRVRLPTDKARRDLGFTPQVDFVSACGKSVAWLDFAGYPVRRDSIGSGEPLSFSLNPRAPRHVT